MDDVEARAFRRWKASQAPEDAQAWAVAHARSLHRPKGETLFCELDTAVRYGETATRTLERAAEVYLGKRLGECAVQDFHWLTQSHFWAMGPEHSTPRVLAKIRLFFSDHDLAFPEGNEETARTQFAEGSQNDSEAQRLRVEVNQLKVKVARVERENRKLQEELAYSSDALELNRLQTQVANLQASLAARAEENERLIRTIQAGAKKRKA